MSEIKITRRIPMETYAYYELEFNSVEVFEQNYKQIRRAIDEQEKVESKPVETKTVGNFTKKLI